MVGRTIYRDFGNVVLNTTLDGVQYTVDTPNLDLIFLAGYSGLVFKSGSTVVISQADLADRTVPEDVTQPLTLLGPPRAVAYVEADFAHLIPDQKLMLAEAVQLDLRTSGVAKDGDSHSNFSPGRDRAGPHELHRSGAERPHYPVRCTGTSGPTRDSACR